jgi:hypothetical protein
MKSIVAAALILSATTVSADMTNPEHKSIVEDMYHTIAPLYLGNRACNERSVARDLLAKANKAIEPVMNDEIDRSWRGMIWQEEEHKAERKWGKVLRAIERNPSSKDAVETCASLKTAAVKIISK